jgi:hypothetical protein
MHYLQDNSLRWFLQIDDIVLIHHLNDDIIGLQIIYGLRMVLVDIRFEQHQVVQVE